MKNYYICDSCLFQFERTGECDQCPICGKYRVREANEEEAENYMKAKNDN